MDNWQTIIINHLTKSSVSGAPTPPPSAWLRAPPWPWPPETRPASCRHPDQVKTEENVKKNKHDICNNRQYTITQHNNMLPALLDVFMSSINFISPHLLSWDFLCVWWIVKQRTGYSNRLMLLSFHVMLILNGHFLIRSPYKKVLTMQSETQWTQVYK